VSDELLNNDPIDPSSSLPINTMGSEPSSVPPGAIESPTNTDIPVPLNNDNEPISIQNTENVKSEELPINTESNETKADPIQTPEPVSVPSSGESGMGQKPVSDPFNPVQDKPLPISTPLKPSQKDLWKRFLDKVQIGKRKKLEKIMMLFLKNSKITNDEVEKFLHVSDKTAERYLNILEKKNKIKQVGKTGHAVSYTKI